MRSLIENEKVKLLISILYQLYIELDALHGDRKSLPCALCQSFGSLLLLEPLFI